MEFIPWVFSPPPAGARVSQDGPHFGCVPKRANFGGSWYCSPKRLVVRKRAYIPLRLTSWKNPQGTTRAGEVLTSGPQSETFISPLPAPPWPWPKRAGTPRARRTGGFSGQGWVISCQVGPVGGALCSAGGSGAAKWKQWLGILSLAHPRRRWLSDVFKKAPAGIRCIVCLQGLSAGSREDVQSLAMEHPKARTLLDVACGTAEHDRFLSAATRWMAGHQP